VKQHVSTPMKIKHYFMTEVPPAGSRLDGELLREAFAELKRKYGRDYHYYIAAEGRDWARIGASGLTDQEVDSIFVSTNPNPPKKRLKIDKFQGMDPIPFDPEWVDCGGPVD